VNVRVEGANKELNHEITRENSLTQEQLDSWRKHICGLEPAAGKQPVAPKPALAQPATAAVNKSAPQSVPKPAPTMVKSPAPAAAKPAADKDMATLAAEVLDADEEEDVIAFDADARGDFIRTRYAEERERLRGTANDPKRSDELAFQFILKEFSLRRPDLETILRGA